MLDALSNKTLPVGNITLQLLLDIGSFLSAGRVCNVRHNLLTMNFWSTVHTLFKGKHCVSLGHIWQADHRTDMNTTEDCQFNKIVSSAKSIRKHTSVVQALHVRLKSHCMFLGIYIMTIIMQKQ